MYWWKPLCGRNIRKTQISKNWECMSWGMAILYRLKKVCSNRSINCRIPAVHRQTDRQTDRQIHRQTERQTDLGAPFQNLELARSKELSPVPNDEKSLSKSGPKWLNESPLNSHTWWSNCFNEKKTFKVVCFTCYKIQSHAALKQQLLHNGEG